MTVIDRLDQNHLLLDSRIHGNDDMVFKLI